MEPLSGVESSSFDVFNSKLQASALKATRSAVGLPVDIAFHRSIDPAFAKDVDAFSSRVLSLTNKLLNFVATADESQRSKGKGKAKLQSQDDVVDNFHSLVVDSMDQLLERTVSDLRCLSYPKFKIYRTSAWTSSLVGTRLPPSPSTRQ